MYRIFIFVLVVVFSRMHVHVSCTIARVDKSIKWFFSSDKGCRDLAKVSFSNMFVYEDEIQGTEYVYLYTRIGAGVFMYVFVYVYVCAFTVCNIDFS